jgi:hypothetical protein
MQFNDVSEFVRAAPFRPFRITLTDGRTYDVHHPELIMVGISSVIVGRPAPNTEEPAYDRAVTVSMSHIMQIEPLESAEAQASR